MTDGQQVESFANLPSFIVSPTNPTGNLNLFISPSCSDCELLTLNVLTAYRNNDPDFSGIRTTFSLIPANIRDVDLISGFMCIDSAHRPKAIKDYYTMINNKIHMNNITKEVSEESYINIMSNHSITKVIRETCEKNQDNQSIVGKVYYISDKYHTQNVVPISIYNDKTLNAIKFSDLKRAMR